MNWSTSLNLTDLIHQISSKKKVPMCGNKTVKQNHGPKVAINRKGYDPVFRIGLTRNKESIAFERK